MGYPAALLPDLLVGWQKVADRYKIPIYVFLTGDTYHAVSNETQGVGAPGRYSGPQAGSDAGSPKIDMRELFTRTSEAGLEHASFHSSTRRVSALRLRPSS